MNEEMEPEDNLVQKLVRWKNLVFQSCPAKFVGGGIPYCLLGGSGCNYLHCPRNIYVQPSLTENPQTESVSPIPEKPGSEEKTGEVSA